METIEKHTDKQGQPYWLCTGRVGERAIVAEGGTRQEALLNYSTLNRDVQQREGLDYGC